MTELRSMSVDELLRINSECGGPEDVADELARRLAKAEAKMYSAQGSSQGWESEFDKLLIDRDAWKARAEAAEAVVDDLGKELYLIADNLSDHPSECLGIRGDGFNSWPIRDELIDGCRKAAKRGEAALAARQQATAEPGHRAGGA